MLINKALTRLQGEARRGKADPDDDGNLRRIPDDLSSSPEKMMLWYRNQQKALADAKLVLLDDRRFEYLTEDMADALLWRFFVQAKRDRASQVGPFIKAHARTPDDVVCYFPVENLEVSETIEIGEAKLLPPGDVNVPQFRPALSSVVHGAVIAIGCSSAQVI